MLLLSIYACVIIYRVITAISLKIWTKGIEYTEGKPAITRFHVHLPPASVRVGFFLLLATHCFLHEHFEMTKYFLLSVLLTCGALLVHSAHGVAPLARGHLQEHQYQFVLESFQNLRQAREERFDIIAGAWADVDLQQLDRISAALENHLGDAGKRMEGHSGNVINERKVYAALARMKNVRRICEIGFNGGHSASLWLWANPNAEVVMFDLWEHDASPLGEQFLLSEEARSMGILDAGSRLKIVKGNSLSTVPRFAAENPSTKCDLISVDGGHSFEVALVDIAHMHNLANPRFNTMLVDDTECTAYYCVDAVLEEHQRRGTLRKLLSVSLAPHDGTRGLSVGTYLY